MYCLRCRAVAVALCAAVVVGGAIYPGPAAAQQPSYDKLPPPPWPADRVRDITLQIKRTLRTSEPLSDSDRTKIEAYYERIYFPRFTDYDDAKTLNTLPTERQKFFQEVANTRRNDDVHRTVVLSALKVMSTVVRGNYHPVSRVNAMLLIGELNAAESGTRTAPNPLPQALTVMVEQLENPDQIDGVRVAALVGILRHVQLDRLRSRETRISREGRNLIIGRTMRLLTEQQPPAGRTPEGHAWLQRRAVDILATLGEAGPNGEVVKALADVVGHKESPLFLRCAAAEALGTIGVAANANLDVAATSKGLAAVAADVCDQEMQRLERLRTENPGLATLDDTRRRLKHRLGCVYAALGGADKSGGLAAVAGQEPTFATVHQHVDRMVKLLDGAGASAMGLARNVDQIKIALVAQLSGPAAAPPEGPPAEGPAAPAEGPAADPGPAGDGPPFEPAA